LLAIPEGATDLPAALADKPTAPEGRGTLCLGRTCLASVDSLEALLAQVRSLPTAA
jgi:hypothetical protein